MDNLEVTNVKISYLSPADLAEVSAVGGVTQPWIVVVEGQNNEVAVMGHPTRTSARSQAKKIRMALKVR